MATSMMASANDFDKRISTIRLRPNNFLPSGKVRQMAAFECSSTVISRGIQGRNDAERNQKVLELLPLLQRIARRMRAHLPAHIEVDDLVGAGSVGLVEAVRKFDARKQVKIESYAQHRIRGAILDSLRSMDGASRDLRKKNKKAEYDHRELEAQLGHPATNQEMANAQGVSLNAWYRTVREIQPLGVEWLRPMGSVGVKQLTEETLPAEGMENQFDLCYRREQRDFLNRALTSLSERERMIVCLYYARERTMKQIGAKLKIDESRVSQLHSAVLARLRNTIKSLTRPPRAGFVPSSEAGELDAA